MHRRTRYVLALVLITLGGCGPSAMPASQDPIATPVSTVRADQQGTLAYTVDGDVFVRVVPDGVPHRLTTDGQNNSPRWSSSGAWLSLCKGSELWVIRRDGSDAHATGSCGDVWLPGTDRTVAPDKVWNAERTAYAFVQMVLTGKQDSANAPERRASIWRANADGSSATELLDAGPMNAPSPYGFMLAGWHGNQILYWQDPSFSQSVLADGQPLWSLPTTGGAPRQLAPTLLLYDDFQTFSPDGATLALTVGGDRESWTNKRIATLDLAGGTLTYLTDVQTAAIAPVWSLNGSSIVYSAMRDSAQQPEVTDNHELVMQRHIWLMQRDGNHQRQLTNDPVYRDEAPRFTADGTHILFARLSSHDQVSIWMMRADGTALTQVADGIGIKQGDNDAPVWFGYYGHVVWGRMFDWTPQT